jgi:hypothetical protein
MNSDIYKRYQDLINLQPDEVTIIGYKILREYGVYMSEADALTLRAVLQVMRSKAEKEAQS